MRIAVISDVHGNFVALESVLADIRAKGADRIVCLGDTVGYGPDPRRCVATVRRECEVTVIGNHDMALLEPFIAFAFNQWAKDALRFTSLELSSGHVEWLKTLPDFAWDEEHGLMFAHASFNDTEGFAYIDDPAAALRELKRTKHPDIRVFFIGHTHIPFVCSEREGDVGTHGETPLLDGDRFVINVGSVGQPRDGNPHACYGLLDTDAQSFALHRVSYDVIAVMEQMQHIGLPQGLATRLLVGE